MKLIQIFSAIPIAFLALSTFAVETSTPPLQLKAFACDKCSVSEAADLAKIHAPQNTCKHENTERGKADSCPNLTQPVIVASIGDRRIFKFDVVSSVSKNNVEQVHTFERTPTHDETAAVDEFFNIWSDLQQGVSDVSEALSADIQSSANYNSASSLNLSAYGKKRYKKFNEQCKGHFVNFFTFGGRSSIRLQVRSKLKEMFQNYSYEGVVNKGIPIESAIIVGEESSPSSASIEFLGSNKFTFKVTRDQGNELVFDVRIIKRVNGGIVSGFGLDRNRSRISGFTVTDLTKNGNIDLTGGTIDPCITEFLDTLPETRERPETVTGSGTESDPFNYYVGDSEEGHSPLFCTKRVKYPVCTIDIENGGRHCTESSTQYLTVCG